MYTKKTTFGSGFSISLPYFEGEDRLNEFYQRAREIITESFTSLRRDYGGILSADFTVREEGGTVTVTVKQRYRLGGRCVAEKNVSHTWKDGVILKQGANPGKIYRRGKNGS